MGLLDLFSPPKRDDLVFGELVFRQHEWKGKVRVAGLHNQPIPVGIRADRNLDVQCSILFHRLTVDVAEVKRQIASESFKIYEHYVACDRKLGNCDADYANFPVATSEADIWNLLTPFGLTFTLDKLEYDLILWLDVAWPNPHYFVAYLKNSVLYLLDVDG